MDVLINGVVENLRASVKEIIDNENECSPTVDDKYLFLLTSPTFVRHFV